jgi:hypothetical protein
MVRQALMATKLALRLKSLAMAPLLMLRARVVGSRALLMRRRKLARLVESQDLRRDPRRRGRFLAGEG